MDRPRVVVADDHKDFLLSTAALLRAEFDVVDVVNDGVSLLEAVNRLDPDVVVTDISMPGLNGFEVVKKLTSTTSRARVVFLTISQDEDHVQMAMELGALGYVVKPKLASDLVEAVRLALTGHTFVSQP